MLLALTANKAYIVCEVREPGGALAKADQKGTWLQAMAGRHSLEPFWVPETLPALMTGGSKHGFCRRLWASNRSCREGHSGVSGGYTHLCAHQTIGKGSCKVLLERCLWAPYTCCGVGAGTCLYPTLTGRALSTYQQMEHNRCNVPSPKPPSQPA